KRAATTTTVGATTTSDASTTTAAPTTTTSTSTTTTAPPPVLSGFVAKISTVTATDLGASYHAGCPVGPSALRALRMKYWGFDNQAHFGTMVVSAAVVQPVLKVFSSLFRAHFPINR